MLLFIIALSYAKKWRDSRVKESLANLVHEQWSDWMNYLFSKCELNQGDLIIPKEYVQRWTRQMHTQYKDLPEKEKESDRLLASKYIEVFIDKYIR